MDTGPRETGCTPPSQPEHARSTHIPRGCVLHYASAPLKIVRAQKQYMIDDFGIQYLDCVSNVAHVGHCHPQIVSAGQAQMSRLVTAQGFINDCLNQYVKSFLETLPDVLSVCYLVNSGSEANDLALRLAKAYTRRHDVVVFDDAYHGNLGNLIDISPKMFKRMSQGKKDFIHVLPLPDTFRGSYREADVHCGERYSLEAERIIQQAVLNNRQISCFISEPIVVNCGVIMPPRNYYTHLYGLIRDLGGVCIADEVQCGLGRTGEYFWAFQHYGVVPDIVTVGKPLGNGHPMAAVVTTREISDALGEYYSTFGGNPVACAIGLAVLDVIQNEKLVQSAKAVGKTLIENFQHLKTKHANIGDVRGMGLCIGIEFVMDKVSRKPARELTEAVIYRLKEEHHILVQAQGPDKNVITLTPPMCFNQQNARSLVQALDEVLSTNAHESSRQNLSFNQGIQFGNTGDVVSVEALDSIDDEEDIEGPEAKRARPSYDDID
ncbi:ethanolamine-phosphate phospho-lyase-like isoform X2 [Oratosquilla oratoria]|uniref:ethanolamine-phosphate phospho-lyase-like isoform X2 n=1 Tax=Oratosquilla oratoria TaxID=337810 RepID=UPI003F7661F6